MNSKNSITIVSHYNISLQLSQEKLAGCLITMMQAELNQIKYHVWRAQP